MSKFQGVLPAFYACYDDNGEISPERVRTFALHLMKKGIQGLYVGGSSGECIYQSVAERKTVLENVMEATEGKITIIAHVACNNTRDSQKLAAHAEALGVDAIAAIPPIYFKLPDRAIAKYWNDISSSAPNTPFIIYNIPQLAGVGLSIPLFKEMLKNPMVQGVKNSSMPTQDIQQFKMYGGEGFTVFNGPDEQFVAGRIIGADGGIGGTYGCMPELYLQADKYIKNNEVKNATAIQNDINAIIFKFKEAQCNINAVKKAIIKQREGLDIGSVRLPLLPLCPGDERIVNEACIMIDKAIATYCQGKD